MAGRVLGGPGKHGFAFFIGEAAHQAGRQALAAEYLAHFVLYADHERNAEKVERARTYLEELRARGCVPQPRLDRPGPCLLINPSRRQSAK